MFPIQLQVFGCVHVMDLPLVLALMVLYTSLFCLVLLFVVSLQVSFGLLKVATLIQLLLKLPQKKVLFQEFSGLLCKEVRLSELFLVHSSYNTWKICPIF